VIRFEFNMPVEDGKPEPSLSLTPSAAFSSEIQESVHAERWHVPSSDELLGTEAAETWLCLSLESASAK
jgi:hypothetical protein